MQVKFDGSFIKQDKVTFTLKAVLYFYIVYEINIWPYYAGADFALGNSLFGAVKLTKNADLDKYPIQDMVLDLMCLQSYHWQMVIDLVKM